jgi:uncharacterized protein
MVIVWAIAAMAAAYIAAIAVIYARQEKMLFHPKRFPKSMVFKYDWEFDEFFIKASEGAEINMLRFPVENPKGAILFLHGNRGNLAKSGSFFGRVKDYGYDVYMPDYRGYGKSSGQLSYKAMLRDAEICFDWVSKHSALPVAVHGTSLGSGMASHIAAVRKPEFIVLETPYYSISRIANKRFPFFIHDIFVRFPFSNAKKLPSASCPSYIIAGTADTTTPFSDVQDLCALSPSTKLFVIEGGGHSNLKEFPEYFAALKDIYAQEK